MGSHSVAGTVQPRNVTAAAARLLVATAIVGLGSWSLQSQPAVAQAAADVGTVRSFSIPAQPLAGALNAFGRQSGLQVTLAASMSRGVTSRAVNGSYTPQQALAILLEGTGIPLRIGADRTALVGQQVSIDDGAIVADGSTVLDPIVIQGANPNSTFGLPETYAGGQVATGGQVGMLGNRDVMDTPFSQTSYTRKTIEDQQAQTVQEVLANDPSIVFSSKNNNINDMGTIRGFTSIGNVGSRSLNGLAGLAPLQYPSVDYIERVEVLKGPSALLNGMQTRTNLGGTVNLVTKKAGDEPLTQLTTRYISDSQFGAHVDFARRFGENKEFGIRFNGAYSGGDTPVDTQSAKDANVALNLDYKGERVRLSADFAHQSQHINPPSTGLSLWQFRDMFTDIPSPPSNSTSLSPDWATTRNKITLGMIQGEVDVHDNLTVYGAIGAQQFEQSGIYVITDLLDPQGRLEVWPNSQRSTYDVVSMQGGVRGTATTGPVSHAFGLHMTDSRWTARWRDGYGDSFFVDDMYNPVFPSLPFLPEPFEEEPSKADLSSIGIADTLSILDERIQFTAGVRYQTVKTSGPWSEPYDSDAWTPSFALVVKPRENVSLYANYIEGLEPGITVGPWYSNPGEILPNYLTKQVEAGVKVDWGRVTTTLAVFETNSQAAIAIPDAGGGLPRLAADGEARNRGIELSAYGEVLDGVRLLGGVTLLDSRLTKTADGRLDGTRNYGAPEVRAVIGGEWDTPFVEGLTLSGRFTYTGSQVVANGYPDLKIPSWTQVDLGARYVFQPSWTSTPVTVRFNVDNVFNNSYWKGIAGQNGDITRSEPRTFRLATTFTF